MQRNVKRSRLGTGSKQTVTSYLTNCHGFFTSGAQLTIPILRNKSSLVTHSVRSVISSHLLFDALYVMQLKGSR